MTLDVMRYAVGVVTSPVTLIKFTPTVSLVRCVSAFYGLISATSLPKVTVLPAGTSPLGMKKMVFVTDEMRVPTPFSSRPISFANEFSQMALVGTLIICLYSSDAPVAGSMRTFTWWCPCRFVASTLTYFTIGSTLVPCALVLYRCVARGRSYLFPV